METSSSSTGFASLGRKGAGWQVNHRSISQKAVDSQKNARLIQRLFREFLTRHCYSIGNAHLVALTLRDNKKDIYTQFDIKRWEKMKEEGIPVYVGAFRKEEGNSYTLVRWRKYDSFNDFAGCFTNSNDISDENHYSKRTTKSSSGDGDRYLITIRTTDDNWQEVGCA